MKPLLCVALCLSFLLAGCELVFQAGTGLSGKAYDDHQKSIKPYLHYWDKPGMTMEGKRRDARECGADYSDKYPEFVDKVQFSDAREKAERRPQEKNNFAARERLSQAWVECMKAKGYRYAK